MHSTTLTETVAGQIKKSIIVGDYAVGSQLPNEQILSEKLNVSRNTVREAVKLLVSKNVLEIERGRGTFVAAIPGLIEDPFGLEFVSADSLKRDLCQFRTIVEPDVCALAAVNASRQQIEKMGKAVERMGEISQLVVSSSVEEYIDEFIDEELKFHELIYKMTHNIIFERMMDIISRSVFINCTELRYRQTFDFVKYTKTHENIYQAILARDPEAARKYAREHSGTFELIQSEEQQ